jgi:hypothetical protein
LDKILKIEALFFEGKSIDEEQTKLYHTKANVEKSYADILSLKKQLEEFAVKEV